MSQSTSPEVNVLEPIYSTSFDVEFTSIELTEEEKDLLSRCVVSTSFKSITFGMFQIGKEIVPIEALLKLHNAGKRFDVIVSIFDKVGNVIGTIIYKECNLELDLSELFSFNVSVFGMDFADKKKIATTLHPHTVIFNTKEI